MGKLSDVNLTVADMAVSLKGHDTGRLYIVASEVNEDFVLVVDGKYRPLEFPKLKRRKHLAFVKKARLGDDLIISEQIKAEEQNAKRR